jgi:phage baseplate assembly protein V
MPALPRSRAADQRFYGVVEATVEDNVDPANEGRIKVRFPWFDRQMVSEWCRVAQLYAGNGYGAYFVPEKNDEVLVAFVHGYMRIPIIIGGLYNGKDKPPKARNGDDPKYIQTKAGHRIFIEDAAGKQKIEIVDASGDNSIVLDTAANTVTILGQMNVTVEAKTGTLTLKGKTGVEIKSEGTLTAQASGPVTIRGATIALN